MRKTGSAVFGRAASIVAHVWKRKAVPHEQPSSMLVNDRPAGRAGRFSSAQSRLLWMSRERSPARGSFATLSGQRQTKGSANKGVESRIACPRNRANKGVGSRIACPRNRRKRPEISPVRAAKRPAIRPTLVPPGPPRLRPSDRRRRRVIPMTSVHPGHLAGDGTTHGPETAGNHPPLPTSNRSR
jgi:hypothetical protein